MRAEKFPRGDQRRMKNVFPRALALAALMVAAAGCPMTTPYRLRNQPPVAAPSAPPPDEYARRRDEAPAPQARAPIEPPAPIYEEDLRERRVVPPPARSQEPAPRLPPPAPPQEEARRLPPPPAPPREPLPPPPSPPLADDSSLLAKITPATTPQRAASIRLTEEGRKLLDAGEAAKALSRLEKTIAIDSSNPYGYYYLAKAHYLLGRHQESLKFLDVAESLVGTNAFWLAEVFALRGEDYRALGAYDRAETSYAQALKLNPGNRLAADGASRLQGDARPELR